MYCRKLTQTKCYAALFNVCYQLVSMTFFCMVVSYLRLVLHALYFHVALVLGGSILFDFLCSQLLGNFACCKLPDSRLFIMQVFTSVVVMILSSMLFFTIHILLGVDNGDLNPYIILVATLLCSLAKFSFGSFLSRLRQLFRFDPDSGISAGFPGLFLGAAIWTGLLWLPIDFLTEAYWLFGVTSIIVFSFACLILFGYYCSLSWEEPMRSHMWVPSESNPPSLSGDQKTDCCGTVGKFGCTEWFSLFRVFLFNVSVTPISYFLIDWQIKSCGDTTCFQLPYLGLNDMNYPLRTYWLLSVTSAAGYLVLSVIVMCCNFPCLPELPVTILTMATFDVALFAIGYTGNQPWWTIMLFISLGFYLSSSCFIKNLTMRLLLKVDNSSYFDPYTPSQRFFSMFAFLGQVIGILLISLVLEIFDDYSILFKILSVLVLLTWVLMVIHHMGFRVPWSTKSTSDNYKYSSRPNHA